MSRKRMDLTKRSNQLVLVGLTAMIEDDGLTFHEALEVLEDIKNQTAPALMEIAAEQRHPDSEEAETP